MTSLIDKMKSQLNHEREFTQFVCNEAKWTEPGIQGYLSSRRKGLSVGAAVGVQFLKAAGLVTVVTLPLFFMKGRLIEFRPLDRLMNRIWNLFPSSYLSFLENNYWFTALVHAPIFEETLFRGVMQSGIKLASRPLIAAALRRTDTPEESIGEKSLEISRWVAIIPTAVCFGLIHNQAQQQVAATVAGVLFGYAKELSGGNLVVPMVAHCANNAIALRNLQRLDALRWLFRFVKHTFTP